VANPSVNTIVPVFDFLVEDDQPIIQSAHANARIIIGTQNADLAPMQQLAAGNTAVKVEVGDPTSWEGWGEVDQALRGILGMKPAANENVPTRLFEPSNIKQVNLSANQATWYGNAKFSADYETLWGVK
jgi:hypothetical protein